MTWNMNLASKRDPDTNWAFLDRLIEDEDIDVALLSEAVASPRTDTLYGSRGSSGTIGRDSKPRDWSTAITSKYGPVEIQDAVAVNYLGHPRTHLPFASSRPGAWTAAQVTLEEELTVTFISLYGLLDDLADASVHRSLSDLDALFTDPRYNKYIVVGGDLNISTQMPEGPVRARSRSAAVFTRLRALGLAECLEGKWNAARRIEHCPCEQGDECRHVQTKKSDKYQMDYLFASKSLTLDDCFPIEPQLWRDYSDHAPVLGRFTY
jgi:endonuclease/exonuclease/phosphatase family metal-dependent hydrolase